MHRDLELCVFLNQHTNQRNHGCADLKERSIYNIIYTTVSDG